MKWESTLVRASRQTVKETHTRRAQPRSEQSLVALLAFLVWGCSGSEDPREAGAGAGLGVDPQRAAPSRELANPSVLRGPGTQERLDPDVAAQDQARWPAEQVTNELVAGPLGALRSLTRGSWSDAAEPPTLDAVFTADARVASWAACWGPLEAAVQDEPTPGVLRRRWSAACERVDAATFAAELVALHARVARVRWALWKPAAIALEPYGASTRVRVGVSSEDAHGGLRYDSAVWTFEWVETPAGWRCRAAEPEGPRESLVSGAPHWVDTTAEAFAGTRFDPRNGFLGENLYMGIGLSDLDRDGDLDALIARPLSLAFNRGDGTFEDRSAELLGSLRAIEPEYERVVWSLLAADFDRDGDQDLFLALAKRKCVLLLQQPSGAFEARVVAASRAVIPSSLAAEDVDGDGWLDVFVGGYGSFVREGPNVPDQATNGTSNQLLRGLPGGRFEDVTADWGVAKFAERWTLAASFGDADGDGDRDLYAANDFGPNVLYRRRAEPPYFEAEIEDLATVDPGFSMSATFADLNGDGAQDLYVSNMASTAARRIWRQADAQVAWKEAAPDLSALWRRMSKGNTVSLGASGRLVAQAGTGAEEAKWAWGAGVFDYDCDGDLDIHVLNGFFSRGRDDGRDL